jgi:hypothetical protein
LVIAGYLFVDNCNGISSGLLNGHASSSVPLINQNIQMKYLSMLHAFYGQGIRAMVSRVRREVEEVLRDISDFRDLQENYSNLKLKGKFDEVITNCLFVMKYLFVLSLMVTLIHDVCVFFCFGKNRYEHGWHLF